MRPIARLGGLVSALVLGSMLVSPPSYAAKSLTVSCTGESGLVNYPAGTAEVRVLITFEDGLTGTGSTAPPLFSPQRAGETPIFNETSRTFAAIEASALSKTGKVIATGLATCV